MTRKTFGACLMLLGVATSHAQSSNPGFEAVCKDIVTHGFRSATDIQGENLGDSWTTNEKFNSSWQFSFSPPDKLRIDNKPAFILAQNPGLIIAAEAPGNNGNAAGVWTYAIHLGMRKVVASQVNAAGNFDPRMQIIKARTTSFSCEFDLNE
jgi:hypothetical protein